MTLFNNPEGNPPEVNSNPENAITDLYKRVEAKDKEAPGTEEEDWLEEPEEEEEATEEEVEEDVEEEAEEEEETEEEEEPEEEEEDLKFDDVKDVEVEIGNNKLKVKDVVKSYQNLQGEYTKVTQERSQLKNEVEQLGKFEEAANHYYELKEAMDEIPELRNNMMKVFSEPKIQKEIQEFSKKRKEKLEKEKANQTQAQPQTQQTPQQEPSQEQIQQAQEALDKFKEVHGEEYDMELIVQTAGKINAPISYDGLKQALAVAYADDLLSKGAPKKQETISKKSKKRLKPQTPAKAPPKEPEPDVDEGDELLSLAKKTRVRPFG